MTNDASQHKPLAQSTCLEENTSFLSPCNAQLLEHITNNPRAAAETLRKVEAQATPAGVQAGFDVVPWPLVLSQERVADFKLLVQELPAIVLRVLRSFFGSNAQAFCDYFDSSAEIYDMLMASAIQPGELICRHDFLYSNGELKLLEMNMGTNLGGWELDWLHGDTLKAVAFLGALPGKRIVYRPVVPSMLDALAKSITMRNKPGRTGNLLFRTGKMSRVGTINTAQLIQSHYQTSKNYKGGKVYVFSDLAEVQFTDTGRVYFQGHEIDAVLLLDAQISEKHFDLFDRAHVAGNILFPDSSIHRVIGSKRLMALLHEERARHLMSERQATWIDKHLPWTARAERKTVRWENSEYDLRELLLQRRERFVLKEAFSLQGRDVFIGKHTENDKWISLVDKARADATWVVQEFCPSDPIYSSNAQSRTQAIIPVLAAFGFGESYGGSVARGLPVDLDQGVVNLSLGAEVFVLLEDHTPR